jgi:predicted RNA-binding Zn-ribbon protein involved in translation (DUF1610 family)
MSSAHKHCLSCGHHLSESDRYCPECGLETVYRNLSLRFLLKSFFEAFLNFDVKIFHSMRDIWIPNKITKTFLEGKSEYHIHPFRFYFICLLIFFTLLSFYTKNLHLDIPDFRLEAQKYAMFVEVDSISRSYEALCTEGTIDSMLQDLEPAYSGMKQDTFFKLDLVGSDMKKYAVTTFDALSMEKEALFDKYNISSDRDRYIMTQYIRVAKNPDAATRFVIGNMIWGLILLTIIIAGFLKLLYVRHESYYIEHLLHISNYHCLNIIVLSIAMALQFFMKWDNFEMIVIWIHTAGILYLLISLQRYYGEKIIKTLFKLMMLGFFYWTSIFFILFLIAMISFITY